MDTAVVIRYINQLRAKGFAVIDPLDAYQILEVRSWFDSKDVYYDAHVPQTARNANRMPGPRDLYHGECCCVSTDDAILAPHLWERALGLTDTVAEYLGVETPTLYSANAFWTISGDGGSRPDIQAFHEDKDDVRFLAMFTMLTDTNVNMGQHELKGPDGVTRSIYGNAGTTFLADTSFPHRGAKPWHQHHLPPRSRGIHWFRWGISERPAANVWDKIEPISASRLGDRYPTDPRLRQSVRLLAQ